MARRRTCLASSVLCTDGFLELTHEAMALYVHLNFHADNDGFLDSARSATRGGGFSPEALSELVGNGYLLEFDGGYLIDDWWVHNTRNSRDYRPGDHAEAIWDAYGDRLAAGVGVERRYSAYVDEGQGSSNGSTLETREGAEGHPRLKEKNTKEKKKKEGNQTEGRCPVCRKPATVFSDPLGRRVFDCPSCGLVE